MVESLLSNARAESKSLNVRDFVELLRSDLLVDGHEPEQRAVLENLSWERYLELDKALGDERPGPRFYYLDGTLEIMTTSDEHERIKKWISRLLELFMEEVADLDITLRGQATMREVLEKAGAEPDDSWCLKTEKKFPDLVLEIALTSGGVQKLELYRRFAVPEVWIWRKGQLEIHALLSGGGTYERVPASRLLPGLDIPLLERCVSITSWREARQAFRAGLRK
jgi:Uma2 family endonuclease